MEEVKSDETTETPEPSDDADRADESMESPTDEPTTAEAEPDVESTNPTEEQTSGEAATQFRGQSPDEETPAEEPATTESADELALTDDEDEESDAKPLEYQSLDEVRDEIRFQLARQQVAERLDAKMAALRGELVMAHRSWSVKLIDADETGQPRPDPPEVLTSLDALADKHGLEFQKTGELSFLEFRETPVGKSTENQQYEAPLWQVFQARESGDQDLVDLFEPVTSRDLDGNRYLALKVSDTPRHVPELAEVRDRVVQAWKMQEAAKLALERAEELAQEAQDSGLPLEEFFVGKDVVTTRTDPFSWLTIGNVSPTTGMVFFRLSEPEGISAAGPAIMESVFSLDEGEVTAELNHDHTVAYVLRIVQHLSGPAQLRRDFLAEADRWYGLPSMTMYRRQVAQQALISDLIAASGVDWQRTPDELAME